MALSSRFSKLVTHLRKVAEEAAGSAHDAAQAFVEVIDVSEVEG
jgi:hypothetical protein